MTLKGDHDATSTTFRCHALGQVDDVGSSSLGGLCRVFPIGLDGEIALLTRKRKSSPNGASRKDDRSAMPVGSNQLLVDTILNRHFESEPARESLPMLLIRLVTGLTV